MTSLCYLFHKLVIMLHPNYKSNPKHDKSRDKSVSLLLPSGVSIDLMQLFNFDLRLYQELLPIKVNILVNPKDN